MRAQCTDAAAVEAALWYHDAVYDPRADDNESRSAALAVSRLHAAGVATERVARIERMILATAHQDRPFDGDAALVLDIDLAVLGADARTFDDYERAVRREYAFVPEAEFRAARQAVLVALLGRPAIYASASFRKRWEAPARANLSRSIAALAN